MGFVQEFKEFAVKGNAVDMAVGIVIGAAFGKIITSLVGDVIMPPIGILLGGTDFGKLGVLLKAAKTDPVSGAVLQPEVVLRYGSFIGNVLDFVIVALCLFLVVKAANIARKIRTQEAPKK